MAYTEWEIDRAAVGQSGIKILLCDDDPTFLNVLQGEITRVFKKVNMQISTPKRLTISLPLQYS